MLGRRSRRENCLHSPVMLAQDHIPLHKKIFHLSTTGCGLEVRLLITHLQAYDQVAQERMKFGAYQHWAEQVPEHGPVLSS